MPAGPAIGASIRVAPLELLPDLLGELFEGGPQAALQGVAIGGTVGLVGPLDRSGGEQVEGCQKALLLVRELFVEGPAGDARESEHVLDACLFVAVLGNRLDHRPVDAGALIANDLVAGESVRTTGEAFVERSCPWGGDLH